MEISFAKKWSYFENATIKEKEGKGVMAKTCCFTGHRDVPKCELEKIRNRLEESIKKEIQSGTIFFACGGAVGFDMIAAEEVLKAKEEYPNIYLVLLLPFPGYTTKWKESDKVRLERILKQSIYRYVSNEYYKGVYFVRDRKLVEGSDTCICYLTKKEHSGTGYTVDKAMDKGLWVINIGNDVLWSGDFFALS